MISTWVHSLIDWTVAALMVGASSSRSMSPPVRTVFRAAGSYHASYSAVTDYEAGLRPWLTMRQHLVLDALGGAALLATGLMMRRQKPAERALLMASGLSELAVVALSSASPKSGPPVARSEPVGYPTLDTLKPVADDVFVVDSVLPGAMGKVLPARMTVIRLANGELLLHSPTRFSAQLQGELQALGAIRHFVAPNIAHWTFLRDWQSACPGATTWAAPGLRQRWQVRRSGMRIDFDLGEAAPSSWGEGITLVMVPGGFGFHEAALFHEVSRTLVLTDLVVNLEPAKVPLVMRPIVRLFGSMTPYGMPPPYVRTVVKLRRPAALLAAYRLLDLAPERVIFAHGRWFEKDGAQTLRQSLRWLVN